jgi:hypothetical protein
VFVAGEAIHAPAIVVMPFLFGKVRGRRRVVHDDFGPLVVLGVIGEVVTLVSKSSTECSMWGPTRRKRCLATYGGIWTLLVADLGGRR